jgi:hypothetical protein
MKLPNHQIMMANNRPKIASLTEKELAILLKESFFKIGKELKLDEKESKLMLDEVYKFQGWMFADTFSDAFSRFAACQLADSENMRPEASPRFIGKLMKLYFKQCAEKKYIHQTVKGTFSQLTGEEKFNLFLKHVTMHRCLPGNPDWVGIYEYLVANNKLKPLEKWESLGYMKKLKHAREEVSEWTYGNYEL